MTLPAAHQCFLIPQLLFGHNYYDHRSCSRWDTSFGKPASLPPTQPHPLYSDALYLTGQRQIFFFADIKKGTKDVKSQYTFGVVIMR